MKITEEMVDYIALLSRLKPDAEEKVQMTAELEKIVSYMDVLNILDTDGVEPLSHVFPIRNVMRSDEVSSSFPWGYRRINPYSALCSAIHWAAGVPAKPLSST